MKGKRYKPSSFELAEMASASAAPRTRGHHPITAEQSLAGEASSLAVECLLAWPYVRPWVSALAFGQVRGTHKICISRKKIVVLKAGDIKASGANFFFKMPCDKTCLQISLGLECSAFL